MEVFNKMISTTTQQGLLSGFVVGSRPFETINISHLLFEDDTLVFCGANVDHIFSQKALLVCFEAILGLKVNMTKSALVPVGNVDNAVELARTLESVTYSLPLFRRALLVCFEAISGLKVNMTKSALVPVGNVDNAVELAGTLGSMMYSLPFKYHGLPLGTHFKAKAILDDIVEKIERWLASWKRMYLSKGRRVTLIKSTLSNLPTYSWLFSPSLPQWQII
jgi:hypothetical protein